MEHLKGVKMKKYLVVMCYFIALHATAHEKESDKKENIDEIKQRVTSNLDQRISNLQAAKSCIQSASDHRAIKECRRQLRDSMEKIEDQNKEERKKRRSEKKDSE